eukprot:1178091-Prorocentrum_minimum.AAC.2
MIVTCGTLVWARLRSCGRVVVSDKDRRRCESSHQSSVGACGARIPRMFGGGMLNDLRVAP